jgi:two-component system cell cycle response regulator
LTGSEDVTTSESLQSTARVNLLHGISVGILEDDRATAKVFSKWLEKSDAHTIWCPSLTDFREQLEGPKGWIANPDKAPRILIVDLVLPDGSGLEALTLWRKHFAQSPVIMVTAFASVDNAVDAMRKGAFDFLRKPVEQDELLIVLNRAMEHVRLLHENESLSSAVRVLSMAQTLSGIQEKEQLLKTLGRLLHREFEANECFVFTYNAARRHLECCLDFRNPGCPRRLPETIAQQLVQPHIQALPPPPESIGLFDSPNHNQPKLYVRNNLAAEVIALSSSTGNCAYIVLLDVDIPKRETRNQLYFPIMVQAQRTFQNLDVAAALSFVDELTGLYNQRFLDVALTNEIARSHRYRAPLSVLFIDLDKFKMVNDTYGHLVGSAILKAASRLFRSCMRDADQLLRYGGDEFVAILPSTNTSGAQIVAERIRSAFDTTSFNVAEETAIKEATNIHVTTSIGIACYPETALDARSLVQLADNAMYDSKRAGKNLVSVATVHPQGVERVSHRDGLLGKMPKAGSE